MALPIVAGGDPDAAAKYNEGITNAINALTARSEPNYFSLAGALFNPGRTGNAGEALGSASAELGRQQEQEQQRAPQLAMLKAQLLGQQYEVANKNKALEMLAPYIGASTAAEAGDKVAKGDIPSNLVDSLPGTMMPILASLHPTLADGLNKGFMQDVEKKKLGIQEKEYGLHEKETSLKGQQFGLDTAKILLESGPKALELIKPFINPQTDINPKPGPLALPSVPMPVDNGRISSPFGQRPNPFDSSKQEFHSGIDFAAPEGSPVKAVLGGTVKSVAPMGGYGNRVEIQHKDGTSSYYAHLKDATVKLGDVIGIGQQIGTVGTTGKTTGPHVEFGIHDNGKPLNPTAYMNFAGQPAVQQAAPVAPQVTPAAQPEAAPPSDLSSLPLNVQNKVMQARIEKSDKDWEDYSADIKNVKPFVLERQNKQIAEVMKIAKEDPTVFNILGSGTWWSAAKHAMDEGAKVGKYPVSLPAQTFAEYGNLTDTQLKHLRTVQRNLADIYLASIAERGKVLGSNPTNFEDRLYKAPMATEKDPASIVEEWGKKHLLYNRAKLSLFNAYKPYAASPEQGIGRFFTDKKSPYNTIVQNYGKFYDQLSNE